MRTITLAVLPCLFVASLTVAAYGRTVADLVDDYRASFVRGDFTKASEQARQAVELESNLAGEASLEVFSLRRDYAVILSAQGRDAEAANTLSRLLDQAKTSKAPELVAPIALELSEVLAALGEQDKAKDLLDIAMSAEREVAAKTPVRGDAGISAAGIGVLTARFHQSVWDLFSKVDEEIPGYGRYSYVLYWDQPVASDAFLKLLFGSASFSGRTGVSKDALNIFYFPTRENEVSALRAESVILGRPQPELQLDKIAAAYDLSLSRDILTDYCRLSDDNKFPQPACAAGVFHNGPYIMVTAFPWLARSHPAGKALLIDLSAHLPTVEPLVVQALLKAVHQPEIQPIDRISWTRLQLADLMDGSVLIAKGTMDQISRLKDLLAR